MAGNKIVYGETVFQNQDIKSGICYMETSLLSETLGMNTIEFVVESEDTSLTSFVRNTQMVYFHNDQQIGIFYLRSVSRIGPTYYKFYGVSAIGFLEERTHYGGIYTGETLQEVVDSICGDVPHVVKTNMRELQVYGWLPVATARENLSQLLFSFGAVVRTDMDGVIHIESLWEGVTASIDAGRLFLGGSVTYETEVSQISITEHQYAMASTEMETLYEGATEDGDIITFDAPVYGLQASGFSILESGANYAKVSAGTGSLSGLKYVHTTRVMTRTLSDTDTENVIRVDDATLVSLLNSSSLADRLENYYTCTETIQNDIDYINEQTGAVTEILHPYDSVEKEACLQSLDISMSARLRADAKALVGYQPIPFQQTVIYDNHEILTGEGNWVVPEGVTEVRAVLIGGGGRGNNGSSGGYAASSIIGSTDYDTRTISLLSSNSYSLSATVSAASVSYGNGGSGGSAGNPGNVYEVTLAVTPGDSIAFSCGDSGENVNSTDTIFGEESSASGGVLPYGYTDLVSGITYALAGVNGTSGGRGGSAGNAGSASDSASGGNGCSGDSASSTRSTYNLAPGYWRVDTTATASANVNGAGGGGGGGSGGSRDGLVSGGSGDRASLGTFTVYLTLSGAYNATANAATHYASGGDGGDGGDGAPGETYGSAGSGGGGGGGAGASSAPSVTCDMTLRVTYTKTGTTQTRAARANAQRSSILSLPRGGFGGSGGAGAPGCIILYYGEEKTLTNGRLVTSDGKIMIDKVGRSIIT